MMNGCGYNPKDAQLYELVDMDNPGAVLVEVKDVIASAYPGFDFGRFDAACGSVEDLFAGRYPGYLSCNTHYHDFDHTLHVLLAMARLMAGGAAAGVSLSEKGVDLGLVGALMHDTGYIQGAGDTRGTGAKYTLCHIDRSVDFVKLHYGRDPYFRDDLRNFADILHCTGLNTKIDAIVFSSFEVGLLGKMLGTADLLGQMADRHYLEKLWHLYNEFLEAGIDEYQGLRDFYEKTLSFREETKRRFEDDLGGCSRYALCHFAQFRQIDRDLYAEGIARNMDYLKTILGYDDYIQRLRRFCRQQQGI